MSEEEYHVEKVPTGQEVVTTISRDVRPIKKRSLNPISRILEKRAENRAKLEAQRNRMRA